MSKRALIMIDMLYDFIDPRGSLYCGEWCTDIVGPARRVLEEFRAAGDSIVFLADAHDPDDPEFRLFGRHAVAGTPEARPIAELAPRADEPVVAKQHFNPFIDSVLDEVIAALEPSEVHVAGVCTSICVMETAVELVDRGYKTVIRSDAVADLSLEQHWCAIARMRDTFKIEIAGEDSADSYARKIGQSVHPA